MHPLTPTPHPPQKKKKYIYIYIISRFLNLGAEYLLFYLKSSHFIDIVNDEI